MTLLSVASATAPSPDIDAELAEQDARLVERGLTIWIGAEPTFTRRDSQEPAWLFAAEGDDKRERGRALLESLSKRLQLPAKLTQVVGRIFPGETEPRFCFGAWWTRTEEGKGAPDVAALEAAPVPAPDVVPAEDAWLTVTPDPGVVEINLAPAPELRTFLRWARALYASAAEVGLSPERFRYNGERTDSGGGGQLTLGGPQPRQSPFFLAPTLLPSLLRYFQRHPSLSFAFGPECLGSASQGPRPDEGVRERLDELWVTLERLEARGAEVTPEELGAALSPLLVDASGNSHRAEINVEKLWNPGLPVRGYLGVVEFRSFGMPRTPEALAARAALLRALCVRLTAKPYQELPQHWGTQLHDRFGLPHFLEEDLREVLADLTAHGVGLGPGLTALLLEPEPPLATLTLGDARLTVSEAREFWPLVGDVASQERSTARVVDSSGRRLQLKIEVPLGETPGVVSAAGWVVPMEQEEEAHHVTFVGGVRYRAFTPQPGFLPGLAPHLPLTIGWERGNQIVTATLHGWIPQGGVYPGLPVDAAEARQRCVDRVVVGPAKQPVRFRPVPRQGPGRTLDLRRLSGH